MTFAGAVFGFEHAVAEADDDAPFFNRPASQNVLNQLAMQDDFEWHQACT